MRQSEPAFMRRSVAPQQPSPHRVQLFGAVCGVGTFLLTCYNTQTMSDTKFVFITGGSEGVGFAIAQMFARRGWHVILGARSAEKLQAAATSLGEGAAVSTISVDVTDAASVATARDSILKITDHLDALVNSAGTFKWDAELGELNLQLLNAGSKELVVASFASLLHDGAHVINISSQAALFAPEDPRREGEFEYVKSMQRVDEFSRELAAAHPEWHVYVSHPQLMKGKIAETQFKGRAGFEGIDFDALPGPEIVAQEVEGVVMVQ